MPNSRVLVVDEDAGCRLFTMSSLVSREIDVQTASTVNDAIRQLKAHAYNAMVVDFSLSDVILPGLELNPDMFVVITSSGAIPTINKFGFETAQRDDHEVIASMIERLIS